MRWFKRLLVQPKERTQISLFGTTTLAYMSFGGRFFYDQDHFERTILGILGGEGLGMFIGTIVSKCPILTVPFLMTPAIYLHIKGKKDTCV